MPVSGNYGTPGNPYGDIWSEFWELQWYSGADPSHTQGDIWGREDLTTGNSIATIRVDHYQGSGVWDVPVYATGTSESDVAEVLSVQTPNGDGYIPLVQGGGAFNELGVQHNASRWGWHDNTVGVPNGGILSYGFDDDTTPSTAVDSWNANDGTISGASYYNYAKFGLHSLNFDNSNDYVDIGEVATPSQISVLAWIRPSTNASQESIIDVGSNTGSSGGFFLNSDAGTPEIQLGDGTNYYTMLGSGTFTVGDWQQVVATYASDGSWELHINNSLVDSGTVGDGTLNWTGRTWSLGIRAFDLASDPYGGDMDAVEIVSRPVTTTEIDNHYNTGSISGAPETLDYAPWTKHGDVINSGDVAGNNVSEPNVIYESDPQLLTGESQVFKMWFNGGGFNTTPKIRYAESADGDNWTISGTTLIDGRARPDIYRENGNYWLYVTTTGETAPAIELYRGSNEILSSSDYVGDVLTGGASGDWDGEFLANHSVWKESGTYYMIYEAQSSSTTWKMGEATSSNGESFTKSGDNPTIEGSDFGYSGMVGGPDMHPIGGEYYLIFHLGETSGQPTEGGITNTTDRRTWNQNPDRPVPTFPRTESWEGEHTTAGQVADLHVLTHPDLSETHLWYTGASAQSNGAFDIGHATTNLTIPEIYNYTPSP